jgi:hypothetical protein
MSVMLAKNFDISKIKFSTIKTLDNGGKMLFLNYGEGNTPIFLQTPELELPFDPKYFDDSKTSGKFSITPSLKGMNDNKQVKDFHDKMCEFDEFLKEKAVENSLAWFKKSKISKEAIDSLYTPQVKVSMDPETGEPNGKYPPRIAFKVIKKDEKVQCKIYDNKKNVFDVNGDTEEPVAVENVLMKGSQIKAVLKCNGIWLANGKFGCTWRAEQIRVKVPEGGLQDFAIMSDSDDEGEEEDTSAETTHNLIDDSDDEEEEVVQEEKPPEKPKRKVRKVKVKGSD